MIQYFIHGVVVILFLTIGVSLGCAQEYRVKIYTEEYPPYNHWEDNKVVGTSTELVRDVIERLKGEIFFDEIELVPWARAYDEALNTKNNAVYTIARTKEREELFRWICPVACAEVGIIARKINSIRIDELEDLKGLRVGVVREDVGHQMLRKRLPEYEFDISNSSESNLLKLQQGRIDVFVYDTNVFGSMLEIMGLKPDEFEAVHVLGKMPFCVAFNVDTDEVVLQKFRTAFTEITGSSDGALCQ